MFPLSQVFIVSSISGTTTHHIITILELWSSKLAWTICTLVDEVNAE